MLADIGRKWLVNVRSATKTKDLWCQVCHSDEGRIRDLRLTALALFHLPSFASGHLTFSVSSPWDPSPKYRGRR